MNSIPSKFLVFCALVLTWTLVSCDNDVAKRMETKGSALGKMNEIVVIADEDVWKGAIGDTFRFYFESAYPILPAPEPLFDLRHFTPTDLKVQPLRKELRTYAILSDLSDLESETTQMVRKDLGEERFDYAQDKDDKFSSIGKDKWARGQLLVYLYGKNEAALQTAISKSFGAIAKRVNTHDKKQLKAGMFVDKVHLGLTEQIKTVYGMDFPIPGDFRTAINDEENEVLWLRKNTKKADLNIVFKKQSYDSQAQLSKAAIIAQRDAFGAKYITADSSTDVMVVDTSHLPVYEYGTTIDGHYGKELRGIWEMTESFTGGPFITYMILNEDRKELIFVDVFILGPGSKKRNLMMQLDNMVKSAKILG